jgi:hypothetical protein
MYTNTPKIELLQIIERDFIKQSELSAQEIRQILTLTK